MEYASANVPVVIRSKEMPKVNCGVVKRSTDGVLDFAYKGTHNIMEMSQKRSGARLTQSVGMQ